MKCASSIISEKSVSHQIVLLRENISLLEYRSRSNPNEERDSERMQ